MFILRETVRFLRHHWAAWLMSVLTLGVALGVSGLFALLAWKAHTAMATLRANLAVEAFFDPSIASEDASAIAQQKIEPLAGIARVTFISKEQALDDYSKMSGENVASVLGMNPLPASVKLYLADPSSHSAEALEASLRAVPGIEDVRGDFPLLRAMESRSRTLDRVATILCSLLLLSAFFYALLAGRHSFEVSSETLRTVRLLGGTRFAAAAPIIITSALAGIAAGIAGAGLLALVHSQTLATMSDVVAFPMGRRQMLYAFVAILVAGGAIGAGGAIVSQITRKI